MLEYMNKNRKVFAGAFLFSLVCFGFMLTHHTITIDEETWILADGSSLLWLLQGRFSTQIFNWLFTQNGNYAPFLWDFLSIVLWNLSGIIYAYSLLGKDSGDKRLPLFFFCSYYSSLPFVVGEILSFSMFNLQVCVAMVFTALAFWRSVCLLKGSGKKEIPVILLLLIFAFGVYQALICVYVTAVVGYCLLNFMDGRERLGREIGVCASLCIGSIIIYYLINMGVVFLTGTADYLEENYVGWLDEGGPLRALFMAFANIARVSFGIPVGEVKIYGGVVLCAVTAAFVLFSVWRFFAEKGGRRKAGILFFTAALTAAPFILYLVLGTYKTHGRHLLALPLAGGIEIWLILSAIKRSAAKKTAVVVLSYLLFLNARNMNLLFYYGSIGYEHDRTVANQLMYDIKKAGMDYHKKPVVFVGMEDYDSVPIETSDTIGGSVFAWDDVNIANMADILANEGYRIMKPTPEQIKISLDQMEGMREWPMENSIRETDETIIVYFSQPTGKWFLTNNVE